MNRTSGHRDYNPITVGYIMHAVQLVLIMYEQVYC